MHGIDVAYDEHTILAFPSECLNKLDIIGMPPHLLKLKNRSILMLLWNLNIDRGLCNGVRMVILDLQPRVFYVELLNRECARTRCFVPRNKPITQSIPTTHSLQMNWVSHSPCVCNDNIFCIRTNLLTCRHLIAEAWVWSWTAIRRHILSSVTKIIVQIATIEPLHDKEHCLQRSS